MKKRKVAGTVLFLLLILVIGVFATKLFERKADLDVWDEFYAQPEDSIDIVILGSSLVASSIDPFYLGARTGISVHNLSRAGQTTGLTECYLTEVLKTQSPKIVLIETYRFIGDPRMDSDTILYSIAGLRFSGNKLKTIWEVPILEDWDQRIELLFPIFATHARWNDLVKDDFCEEQRQKSFIKRGYGVPHLGINPQPEILLPSREVSGIADIQKEVLDTIIDLAEQNGTKLLFFNPPNPETIDHSYQAYNAIYEYLDSRNVDYLDCNYQPEIVEKIDTSVDFTDYHHTNAIGLYKTTEYLAEYINKKYALQTTYSRDEEDYQQYLQHKNEYWRETNDLQAYLMMLYDTDYECYVTYEEMGISRTARTVIENASYQVWEEAMDHSFPDGEYVLKMLVRSVDTGKVVDKVVVSPGSSQAEHLLLD